MELLGDILEQIAFNTRPKIQELLSFFMIKSIYKEHLSAPLQTNKKLFKIANNFLNVYNGIFNVTIKNNKFFVAKSITHKHGFFSNSKTPKSLRTQIIK